MGKQPTEVEVEGDSLVYKVKRWRNVVYLTLYCYNVLFPKCVNEAKVETGTSMCCCCDLVDVICMRIQLQIRYYEAKFTIYFSFSAHARF